ncbi:unnamed protein product, partial [Discosporangium mesarthrocarpum]
EVGVESTATVGTGVGMAVAAGAPRELWGAEGSTLGVATVTWLPTSHGCTTGGTQGVPAGIGQVGGATGGGAGPAVSPTPGTDTGAGAGAGVGVGATAEGGEG